jgi:hypothetical protein
MWYFVQQVKACRPSMLSSPPLTHFTTFLDIPRHEKVMLGAKKAQSKTPTVKIKLWGSKLFSVVLNIASAMLQFYTKACTF